MPAPTNIASQVRPATDRKVRPADGTQSRPNIDQNSTPSTGIHALSAVNHLSTPDNGLQPSPVTALPVSTRNKHQPSPVTALPVSSNPLTGPVSAPQAHPAGGLRARHGIPSYSTNGPSAAPFAEQVSTALATWIDDGNARSDFMTLAALLGCPFARGGLDMGQVSPADELLIQNTWIALLYKCFEDVGSPRLVTRHTLTGLLTNDRWHALMGTEKSAYAFVLLAANVAKYEGNLHHLGSPSADHHHKLVLEQLDTSLAKWLPAGHPATTSVRDIAAVFFGEAWCAVVYDNRAAGVTLERLIHESTPTFLPGRLAIDVVREDYALPVLGC
jgi:hypothetical protein